MDRRFGIAFAVTLATLGIASGAQGNVLGGSSAGIAAAPATLTVDNDKKDCPTAGYRTIRAAIGDANPGDTIYVCAGTYAEGPGTPGSAALIIQKSLTLTGAGADLVTVEPKSVGDNPRIAGDDPSLRSFEGDIVSVLGQVRAPITVDISGITFDANGVYATAGVVFSDASGSLNRSRVTGLDIDESANGYSTPGGFRSNQFGDGVAMVTRNVPTKAGNQFPTTLRTVTIDHTRIDHYNAVGVLVDGSTDDFVPGQTSPVTPSGVKIRAILTSDQIAGRNSCQNFNDPTVPPAGVANPTVIDGDCQASGSGATGSIRRCRSPTGRSSARTACASPPARPCRCRATPFRPTSCTGLVRRSEACSPRRRTTIRTRPATTPRGTRTWISEAACAWSARLRRRSQRATLPTTRSAS